MDSYGAEQAAAADLQAKISRASKKLRGQLADHVKTMASLEEQIRAYAVKDLDDADDVELVGSLYSCRIGAQRRKREVTDPLLAFMLLTGAEQIPSQDSGKPVSVVVHVDKLKAFLDVVGMPLGQLDDYLSRPERDKVITEDRAGDGSRTFKVQSRTEKKPSGTKALC